MMRISANHSRRSGSGRRVAPSGQGKTALAYRWLQDETAGTWRVQVKLTNDPRDAIEVAATLSAHAEAVGAPLTVYVDVRPHDSSWPYLIEELARFAQLRVLVTIREEDWRRASLSGAVVAFEDVSLKLGNLEAREIYGLIERPDLPSSITLFVI